MGTVGNNQNVTHRGSALSIQRTQAAEDAGRKVNRPLTGATTTQTTTQPLTLAEPVSELTGAPRADIPGSHHRSVPTTGSLHGRHVQTTSSSSSSQQTRSRSQQAQVDTTSAPIRQRNISQRVSTTGTTGTARAVTRPSVGYQPIKEGGRDKKVEDGFQTQCYIPVTPGGAEGFEKKVEDLTLTSRTNTYAGKDFSFALKNKDLSKTERLRLFARNYIHLHFSGKEIKQRLSHGGLHGLNKGKAALLAFRIEKNFYSALRRTRDTNDDSKLRLLMALARKLEQSYFLHKKIDVTRDSVEMKSLASLQRVLNYGNIALMASAKQLTHYNTYFASDKMEPMYNGKTFAEQFVHHADNGLFDYPKKTHVDFLSWFKLTDKTMVNASVTQGVTREKILDFIKSHTRPEWLERTDALRKIDEALLSSEHFSNHEDYNALLHLLKSAYTAVVPERRTKLLLYILTSLMNRGAALMRAGQDFQSRQTQDTTQTSSDSSTEFTQHSDLLDSVDQNTSKRSTSETRSSRNDQHGVQQATSEQTNTDVPQEQSDVQTSTHDASAISTATDLQPPEPTGTGGTGLLLPRYPHSRPIGMTGSRHETMHGLRRDLAVTAAQLKTAIQNGHDLYNLIKVTQDKLSKGQGSRENFNAIRAEYERNQVYAANLDQRFRALEARIKILEMQGTSSARFTSDVDTRIKYYQTIPRESTTEWFGENWEKLRGDYKGTTEDFHQTLLPAIAKAVTKLGESIRNLYLGSQRVPVPQEPIPTKEGVIAKWKENYKIEDRALPTFVAGLSLMEAKGLLPTEFLWMMNQIAEMPDRTKLFASDFMKHLKTESQTTINTMRIASQQRLERHDTAQYRDQYLAALNNFSRNQRQQMLASELVEPFTVTLTNAMKGLYVPDVDSLSMLSDHYNRIVGDNKFYLRELTLCAEKLDIDDEDFDAFVQAMYIKRMDCPAAEQWIRLGLQDDSGVDLHTPLMQHLLKDELLELGRRYYKDPGLYTRRINGLLLHPKADYTKA